MWGKVFGVWEVLKCVEILWCVEGLDFVVWKVLECVEGILVRGKFFGVWKVLRCGKY